MSNVWSQAMSSSASEGMSMGATEATVACCQLATRFGDVAHNRIVAANAIERAAAQGANVVVLPELCTSGYTIRHHDELAEIAETPDGPSVARWHELARKHNLVIVGGFAEAAPDGRYYNSAVLVDRAGLRGVYRKAHLWDEEARWFTPGDQAPLVVDTEFGRIGVVVCYDLEFPEWVRLAALHGAELMCVPVNWPLFDRPSGERPIEVVQTQAAASANRIFIAACDRAGTERSVACLGGSVIVDSSGYPLTELRLGQEAEVLTRVTVGAARDKSVGPTNDVHRDRRPELYARIL